MEIAAPLLIPRCTPLRALLYIADWCVWLQLDHVAIANMLSLDHPRPVTQLLKVTDPSVSAGRRACVVCAKKL